MYYTDAKKTRKLCTFYCRGKSTCTRTCFFFFFFHTSTFVPGALLYLVRTYECSIHHTWYITGTQRNVAVCERTANLQVQVVVILLLLLCTSTAAAVYIYTSYPGGTYVRVLIHDTFVCEYNNRLICILDYKRVL